MIKKLLIILTLVPLLTSCSVKDEIENEEKQSVATAKVTKIIEDNESILHYQFSESEKYKDKSKYDAICFYKISDVDLDRYNSIIETYLKSKDMFKDNPDGYARYNDYTIGEYYKNAKQDRISFVLKTYDKQSESPEQFTSVICLTVDLKNCVNEGSISYIYDENNNLIEEYLYSDVGNLVSSVTYEQVPYFPFSIIGKYENYEDTDLNIYELLNRNQKLWWLEKDIVDDSNARIVGYKGDPFYQVETDDYLSIKYDFNDKVDHITGKYISEMGFEEDVRLEIDLTYDGEQIDSFTYNRPGWIYGTSDSIGDVLCDELGRMIYNDFYVTHGSIYQFSFYEDDHKLPWVQIVFDSMPYSGWEESGIEYLHGNYISTYFFQNK